MAEAARSRRRAVARRALAVAGGLAFALVAVEVGLRVTGHFVVRAAHSSSGERDSAGLPIVAFVGDSNVFGLYVKTEETLPECVERLSRRGGARGVHCVNLGQPGAPTWVVVEQARRALEMHPVALVVRAGANDTWQVPPNAGLAWLESLRVVRLARRAILAWTASDDDEPSFEIREAPGALEGAAVVERVDRDLAEIAALAERASARCVLATYLCSTLPEMAQIRSQMLEMQGKGGVVVADCAAAFAQTLRGLGVEARAERESRLLTRDRHPTALGYEVEARVVAATLKEIGVLEGEDVGSPLEPIDAEAIEIPMLKQIQGPSLVFEVFGAPRDRITLLLGPPGRSRLKGLPLALNFAPLREVFGSSYHEKLRANADGAGRARVVVPAGARAKLKPPLRAVCIVARGGTGGAERVLLTPTIDVALSR